MASFSSPVQKIEALNFDPIPTKPTNVVRAVRFESAVVLVDKDGRLYANEVNGRFHYTLVPIKDDTRFGRLFEACKRLGLISKEMIDKHNKAAVERQQRRDREWAAKDIEARAEALGLKLTSAQLKVVNAAKALKS